MGVHVRRVLDFLSLSHARVFVIAGPNGAGKSTLTPALLRDTLNIPEYVNADTIAEGLSAFAPEDASFEAGRVMVHRLNELARQRRHLSFETTLASRFYANWIKGLKAVWAWTEESFRTVHADREYLEHSKHIRSEIC